MPTRTRKNFFGFIDPITTIGVLFLVITLAVGVVVTKNNKISLNINEKAGTMCGYCNGATCVSCSAGRTDVGECTSNSQCAGTAGKVCGNGKCETGESPQNCPNDCMTTGGPYCGDGNCNGKETPGSCDVDCGNEGPACQPSCGGRACGDDGCGDICGSCILPATCSSSGQCTVTCTPSCTGKMCGDNGCGGNCGTCPGGSTCQFNSCIANQAPIPQDPIVVVPPVDPVITAPPVVTDTTPTQPQATTAPGATEQTNEDLSRDCFFSGGQWNNTTKTCFNPDIEEVGKEAEQLIASNPIINPPADDYDIESTRNRTDDTAKNIVIPPSITTPKYTNKAECQANVNPNSKAYEACAQYATSSENQNVILQNTQNLLASLSQIPTNYVSYWQNQTGNQEVNFTNFALATYKMVTFDFIANPVLERLNLRDEADSYLDIAFNQQTTLDTADLLTFDKTSRYVSNYQRINEQTYSSNSPDIVNYLNSFNAGIRDKETLASTIDLGVTISEEVYMLGIGGPLALASGGFVPGVITLMGQAQVVSTVSQGSDATTYCLLNGFDENCEQKIGRTGLSVATIGVSQYANTFGNALGRVANTVTTGANFAVDSSDAIVAFSDPNTDALTRAMSIVAVVGDIGGGIMDFNQGQLDNLTTFKADVATIKADLTDLTTTENIIKNYVPKVGEFTPNTSEIPLVEIAPAPKVIAGAGNVEDLPVVKPADDVTAPPSLLAKVQEQVDTFKKSIVPTPIKPRNTEVNVKNLGEGVTLTVTSHRIQVDENTNFHVTTSEWNNGTKVIAMEPGTRLLADGQGVVINNKSYILRITNDIPELIPNYGVRGFLNINQPKVIMIIEDIDTVSIGKIPRTGEIEIGLLKPHEPGTNPSSVAYASSIITSGGSIDPIKITEYNGRIYTYDGANRVRASLDNGLETVPYIFTPYEKLSGINRLLVRTVDQNGGVMMFNVAGFYSTNIPDSPLRMDSSINLNTPAKNSPLLAKVQEQFEKLFDNKKNADTVDIVLSKDAETDKLVKYIVGPDVKDVDQLAQRMQKDQNQIINEYGLPPYSSRFRTPDQYRQSLVTLAEQNGISIKPTTEVPPDIRSKLLEIFPSGYIPPIYEKGILYLPNLDSISDNDLKTMVHELTHGLDEKFKPGLSIEQREYRAYVVELGDAVAVRNSLGDNFTDYVFGQIGVKGSVKKYYATEGITEYPWNKVQNNVQASPSLLAKVQTKIEDAWVNLTEKFNPVAKNVAESEISVSRPKEVDVLKEIDVNSTNNFSDRAETIRLNALNGANQEQLIKDINDLVDDMTTKGFGEFESITYVSAKIQPPYADTPEKIAQLAQANKAKQLEELLVCPYSICRHDQNISNLIARSRGYNTVNVGFTYKSESNSFGHTMTGIITAESPTGLILLDPTNGRVFRDPQIAADINTNDTTKLIGGYMTTKLNTPSGSSVDTVDLFAQNIISADANSNINPDWSSIIEAAKKNQNSFVVKTSDGNNLRIKDLDTVPADYNSKVSKLEYDIKYADPERRTQIESFTARNENGKVILTGKSIGSGASRNAIQVIDVENGTGWVMYGPTTYSTNSEAVGGISMVQTIDDSLSLPIDGLYTGAYRYLPLEDEILLFPRLENKGVINTTLNTVNTMLSSIYPAGVGEVYKFFHIENLKRQGVFDNTELHGGNVSFAVWDNKPYSGFVMPVPKFKWALIGNTKIPVPGISWVTIETIEASYR